MAGVTPVRVALVAGLHATARTEAVDRLLRAVPNSLAVYHDLSEIDTGVVHRVMRDRWGELDRTRVELVHGCVSCTLREDLIPLLVGLAERGEHRFLVVDAWDGVEPRAVAEALTETIVGHHPVTRWLTLTAVLNAVDAGRLLDDLSSGDDMADRGLAVAEEDERSVAEVLARQVEYPTAVTLLPAADARAEVDERAAALVAQLNPAAAILPFSQSALAVLAEGRFDATAAAVRVDPTCAQPPDRCEAGEVRTFTWRRERPLHPERLHEVLEDLVATTVRSRGRFWLASRPDTLLVWDAAGASLAMEAAGPWLAALPEAAWELVPEHRRVAARMDWAGERGDRCQCLSFTGVSLDTERLVRLLDSCLLSEGELRRVADGATWADDPFADLFDTAS